MCVGLSSPMDKAQPIVPASAIKASSTKSRAAHLVEGQALQRSSPTGREERDTTIMHII